MATITTFDARLKAAHVGIHRAIHNPEVTEVIVGKEHYPVKRAPNGCRCVDYDDRIFMEQNKNKQTNYARAAREGKHITWGIGSHRETDDVGRNNWVYIDDDIADAFEARAQKALANIATGS